MKSITFFPALCASALLCAAAPSSAADTAPEPAKKAAAPANPAKNFKPLSIAKSKQAAPAKLIDINSATKQQLKTLPGIGDEQADKIVAGRPYGSKAWLVTHEIIPSLTYESLKAYIVARQK